MNTITQSKSHKATVEAHRDDIVRWFAKGAANAEVAEKLQISTAALHRHTMHWKIKKIPKRPVRKKRGKPDPCSNEIRHLAIHAKWTTKAAN